MGELCELLGRERVQQYERGGWWVVVVGLEVDVDGGWSGWAGLGLLKFEDDN